MVRMVYIYERFGTLPAGGCLELLLPFYFCSAISRDIDK